MLYYKHLKKRKDEYFYDATASSQIFEKIFNRFDFVFLLLAGQSSNEFEFLELCRDSA